MTRARQIEKKARVVGANYTDDASLKHPHTQITWSIAARLAAFVYSIWRVGEYSSSFLDLKDDCMVYAEGAHQESG